MSTSDTPPKEYMPLDVIAPSNSAPSNSTTISSDKNLIARPPVEPARFVSNQDEKERYRRPSYRNSSHRPPPGLEDEKDEDNTETRLPRPPVQLPKDDNEAPPGLWKRSPKSKKNLKVLQSDAPPGLWKRYRDDAPVPLPDDMRASNDDTFPRPDRRFPQHLSGDKERRAMLSDSRVRVYDLPKGAPLPDDMRASNDDTFPRPDRRLPKHLSGDKERRAMLSDDRVPVYDGITAPLPDDMRASNDDTFA